MNHSNYRLSTRFRFLKSFMAFSETSTESPAPSFFNDSPTSSTATSSPFFVTFSGLPAAALSYSIHFCARAFFSPTSANENAFYRQEKTNSSKSNKWICG